LLNFSKFRDTKSPPSGAHEQGTAEQKKLLIKSITNPTKKTKDYLTSINKATKSVAEKLNITDRTDLMAKKANIYCN